MHINIEEAHAKAAEICLQYLSFSDFDTSPSASLALNSYKIIQKDIEKYSMLEYSALNWAIHLKLCNITEDGFNARMIPRLIWFLNADAERTSSTTGKR